MAKQEQNDARLQAKATSNQAQQELAPVIQGNQDQQKVAQDRASADYGAANKGLDVAAGTLDKASGTLDKSGQLLDVAGNTYNDAKSGYKNFADTGGFDAAAKTQYLNRATSGVTNTGTALERQAMLNRSKIGGGGTGGEVSQIARRLMQAQSDATNNAQVDLNSQINANKLSGLGGLNNVATGQTGLGTANTGIANAQTNVGASQREVAQAHSALFDENTGAASDLGKQVLQAMGLKYNTEDEANKLLAELSNNPGTFDNILRTITAIKPGGSYNSNTGNSSVSFGGG